MTSEIHGLGKPPPAGSGYPPGMLRDTVGEMTPPGGSTKFAPGDRLDIRDGAFSALASAKDDVAHVATRIREAGSALERADAVLAEVERQAGWVKNYPPYPPGNQQRADYINSINGLRKVLEAVTFPPMEARCEPVLFPREAGQFELDPSSSGDAEISRISAAATAGRVSIQADLARLHDMAASMGLSWLVPNPGDEVQAASMGASLSQQLQQSGQPISRAGPVLAQLGG